MKYSKMLVTLVRANYKTMVKETLGRLTPRCSGSREKMGSSTWRLTETIEKFKNLNIGFSIRFHH